MRYFAALGVLIGILMLCYTFAFDQRNFDGFFKKNSSYYFIVSFYFQVLFLYKILFATLVVSIFTTLFLFPQLTKKGWHKVILFIQNIFVPFEEVYREYKIQTYFQIVLIVFSVLVGAVMWLFIINGGNIDPYFEDWYEEYRVNKIVQDGFQQGIIPYRANLPLFGENKYLHSWSHINFFPTILLLKYTTINFYFAIQLMFVYLIGIVGLIFFFRRYSLSLFGYFCLFLVFNFNGHIVSHIVGGNFSSWSGYFLFPFFFFYLFNIPKDIAIKKPAIQIAFPFILCLSSMFLLGSLHVFIWANLILLLCVISYRKCLSFFLITIGFCAVILFFRLGTPYFTTMVEGDSIKRIFLGGFPDLVTVLEVLFYMKVTTKELYVYNPKIITSWYDLNHFIGILPGLMIVYFVFYNRYKNFYKQNKKYFFSFLDLTMLCFFIFSFNFFYFFIAEIPFPLFNVETSVTRFLMIPILIGLFLAVIPQQEYFNSAKFSFKKKIFFILGLLQTFFVFVKHTAVWNVQYHSNIMGSRVKNNNNDFDISVYKLENLYGDPDFDKIVTIIKISTLISILGFVVLVILYVLSKRKLLKI